MVWLAGIPAGGFASSSAPVTGRCSLVKTALAAVVPAAFITAAAACVLCQGLEGREPVVLIVDDSSAVWPHDRRNLFVVERYIYFPSSRKRFGMQGKSLLEIDRWARAKGLKSTPCAEYTKLHMK